MVFDPLLVKANSVFGSKPFPFCLFGWSALTGLGAFLGTSILIILSPLNSGNLIFQSAVCIPRSLERI